VPLIQATVSSVDSDILIRNQTGFTAHPNDLPLIQPGIARVHITE
jgi:hypothetical protein